MTTVKFFGCLPLAKARGKQKDNFRVFLIDVPLISVTHDVLLYCLEQKMIMLPVRPDCGRDSAGAIATRCGLEGSGFEL